MRCRLQQLGRIGTALLLILLVLAGCVSSGSYSNTDSSQVDLELITAPSPEYVLTCLQSIPTVIKADIAPKLDDNLNASMLNECLAQIYFALETVDQTEFTCETAAENGVHCGGCVEVFANEDNAKARAEYLSSPAFRLFKPGTQKVIGTLVIRCSQHLSEKQRKDLEETIINVLSSGEIEIPSPPIETLDPSNENKSSGETPNVPDIDPALDPVTGTSPAPSYTPPPTPQPTEEHIPATGSTFSIHFIDVGQADAALIECDGHFMLIDGGNKADSNTIYSVLKKAGASHLDIIVGTHGHEDHIGGLAGAFNYATADVTLCSVTSYDSSAFNNFAKYASQKGGGIIIPSVGDQYALGSATITILGVNGAADANNTSIVLKIQYGVTSFLFAGDAEREAEYAILNSGADLSATVLKVGHHGSDTSTTYPFLREIMPQYAVVSVGNGNSYGHPTDDTLSRLRDAGVKVYRTDMQGDIKCTSDGETVYFTVTKNANADTLASVAKAEPTPTPTPAPTPALDPVPNGPYFVLNTNSKKFHDPDCGSASKISATNKEYYTGLAETLIQMGYSPCDNCKPYETLEPEPTSAPAQNETMVWIPSSGTKYHNYSGCSNMKNPTQVTKSQAVSRGYTACKKCW